MTVKNILIVAIVALIVVAAGIMVLFAPGETGPTPGETVPAQKVLTPDEAKSLAVELAGQIDGDAFAALKPGDENTTAFTAIHDRLNAFRSEHPDIVYIMTMRRTGDAIEQVVDADYGSFGAYAIGDGHFVPNPEAPYLAGFDEPYAEIYSTVYGYAPVRNAAGAGVGVVCIQPDSPIGQEQLEALAVEIAGQIDGDAFAALKPGDENTTAFNAIRDQLVSFRTENPGIYYIYTMRKTENATEYVVDADYGSDGGVAIGEGFTLTSLDTVLLRSFEGPTAEIYSVVCGYAPVKNATDAGLGMVAIEAANPVTGERLKALAVEAAREIDGATMAALKPGDENTTAYTAIQDRLSAFRDANPGVLYVYTMRMTGNATEYVVDADYGNGYAPSIGYTYVPTEEDAAFLVGFEGPSVEPWFYVDEWGNETATVLSGYAPVRDAAGTVVGLVGVDVGFVHKS